MLCYITKDMYLRELYYVYEIGEHIVSATMQKHVPWLTEIKEALTELVSRTPANTEKHICYCVLYHTAEYALDLCTPDARFEQSEARSI